MQQSLVTSRRLSPPESPKQGEEPIEPIDIPDTGKQNQRRLAKLTSKHGFPTISSPIQKRNFNFNHAALNLEGIP